MDLFDIAVAKKMSGGGGGGGSSDFTTCTVTVINNESDIVAGGCANCMEPGVMYEGAPGVIMPIAMISSGTSTFTVPLYKGGVMWDASALGAAVCSGSIQDLGGMLLITGDGTITIS